MKLEIKNKIVLLCLLLMSFSNIGIAQQTPINPLKYFSERSKSVKAHDYFINSNATAVINYFNSVGLIRYSKPNYDNTTIRFRNKANNIFVMVFRTEIPKDKIYIIMSREEYVDEIDESIVIKPSN